MLKPHQYIRTPLEHMIILLMKMMKKIDPNHIDDKNWHDKTNIDNDKYDDHNDNHNKQ